jgi:hypothetical protein
MRLFRILAALVALLALAGCSFLPLPSRPGPTAAGPTSAPSSPAPTQDGPPPPAGIVTLTPDQVQPEDVFTRSEPNGSFPMGLGLPRGFPAGIPAFENRWIKNDFISFTNGDGRLSYGVMFVGGYDDVDALLAEFARQGWSDEGSEILPTRRLYIVQNESYRVIITTTESAETQGKPIDPTHHYTIVVL